MKLRLCFLPDKRNEQIKCVLDFCLFYNYSVHEEMYMYISFRTS